MLVKKKPVIVESYRPWDEKAPAWFEEAILQRTIRERTNGEFEIDTLEGMMIASPGDYIMKGIKGELYSCKPDIYAITYESAEESETPEINYPRNRLLNAFPRPDALNEIYSTGEVDYRGVPVNYSIWRGNHSIMGMTGILFEKGFIEEGDYQEGVVDTDLLEMVHDRLVQLQDYVGNGEWIVQAIISIEVAIKNLLAYQDFCRDIGDTSGC